MTFVYKMKHLRLRYFGSREKYKKKQEGDMY